MALVFASSLPAASVALLIVPLGLLFAPQPIRRDKRTLVLLALTLIFIVAAPLLAEDTGAVSRVCEYCPWWLCIECLIYG